MLCRHDCRCASFCCASADPDLKLKPYGCAFELVYIERITSRGQFRNLELDDLLTKDEVNLELHLLDARATTLTNVCMLLMGSICRESFTKYAFICLLQKVAVTSDCPSTPQPVCCLRLSRTALLLSWLGSTVQRLTEYENKFGQLMSVQVIGWVSRYTRNTATPQSASDH